MAADIILKGARIATGNERTPHADAVSIKNNRFARVGDERDGFGPRDDLVAIEPHRAFEHGSQNALLPPDFAGLQLPVGI